MVLLSMFGRICLVLSAHHQQSFSPIEAIQIFMGVMPMALQHIFYSQVYGGRNGLEEAP